MPETKKQIQDRLKTVMPIGDTDFTDMSETSFVMWFNGHCFLWKFDKDSQKWDCIDEL